MHFQILGPLRVSGDDEREITLGGAKPAALLAMLILRANEVVSSDRLIDDLWDGQPPATAPKTLQVHVSRLRRALGADVIATGRGGYLLEVEPDRIDALRFQTLVAEGRAALAEGAHARASARTRAALALWRGDALGDFGYASFAQDQIARLEGLRAVALESAAEAELALGRHAELIPELKSLVKRHPLSEHLRAQLMLALYRSGRQAEALGVYRTARRILVEQLGIEPGAELKELERAILAQDEALAAPAIQARAHPERAAKSQRGVLVGYENELTALEDLLEESLTRRGRLAFISGEPGVGKTRLADELSSVAETRGAQVVWGRCSIDGGAPAYWPWIQVLRLLIADRDPTTIRAELGGAAVHLAHLLPELRDVVPELETAELPDAEEARFRMFDALAAFLARAASTNPLVIVLDDLHAADRATLSMLRFVGTAAMDAPVLIVGTYRDTEITPLHPLSETLGDLARTTDCLQLVLTGLSSEDTAHFVELSAGVAPLPGLAGAIQEASSGNPLFVTELVRLLRSEGRLQELDRRESLALPRGIDQVIARRLEHLSEPCRRMLSVAAVIGREWDVPLVNRAADSKGEELLQLVEEATASRVADEVAGTDRIRFSHELVRQVLYRRLGAAERRRMHAAVGAALEALNTPRLEAVATELARHFSEALPAGDADKALAYLRLAGNLAAELSAYHEAADFYDRAAAIGKANGAAPQLLCELYVDLSEQLVLVPDLQRARFAIEGAEALAEAHADRALRGRLTVARAHVGLLDSSSLDDKEILAAVELFRELQDPLGEARAWYALVTVACGRSDRTSEEQAARRMLACAKAGGSRGLAGQALRGIGAALANGCVPVSQALPQVQALLAEATDDLTRSRLLICIASLEAARGRFDDARARFDQSRALVPSHERADSQSVLWSLGARMELLAGNFHKAEELGRRLCDHYDSQGLVAFLSSELMFVVDALIPQGRLEEAAAEIERACAVTSPDDVDAHFRQARSRASLALAHGDIESAQAWAQTAVERVRAADASDEHAMTLLVNARVLRAADRPDDARKAALEALAVAEARENVVLTQRARDFLRAAAPAAAV